MKITLFILTVLIGIGVLFLITMLGLTSLTDYLKERRNDKRRQNPSDE